MIPLLAISAMDEFGFTVKANPLRFTSMATDVVQGIISFMMMFFIALLLDELPPQQRRLNDAASDAVAALARRVEIVHANPDPVRS